LDIVTSLQDELVSVLCTTVGLVVLLTGIMMYSSMKAALSRQKKQNVDLKSEIEEHNKRNKALKKELEELEGSLKELKQIPSADCLLKEVDCIQSEIHDLTEAQVDALSAVKAENDAIHEELKQNNEKLNAALKKERKAHEDEIRELKESANSRQSEIETTWREKMKEQEAEQEITHQKLLEASKELESLHEQLNASNTETEDIKKKLAKESKLTASLQTELETLQETQTEALKLKDDEVTKLKEEIHNHQNQLKEREQTIALANKEIEQMKQTIRDLKSTAESVSNDADDHEELKDEIKKLQSEVSSLKELLTKERHRSHASIRQILRESLDNAPADQESDSESSEDSESHEESESHDDSEDSHNDEEEPEAAEPEIELRKDTNVRPRMDSGRLQEEISIKKAKILEHRTAIVNEIYMTEKSYVHVLDTICDEFLKPLEDANKAGQPILRENEIKTVFSCIEVIRNYNRFFLEGLEPRVDNWEENQQIGDIFRELSVWLRAYTPYVNNYDMGMEKYRYLMKKNSKFARFIHEKMKAERHSDLTFLLIAPVQRLPRYVLFLKDLVRYTFPAHQDYEELVEALESVKKTAKEVNRAKKRFEQTEMVFEVAARFDQVYHSEIIAPARRFICDIFMFRDHPRGVNLAHIALQDIYIIILFSDLLIISQPRDHPFRNSDNFSRAKLVTKRKADNQSKSITDFQQADHDLEFVSAVDILQLQIEDDGSDTKVVFRFPVETGEFMDEITLYTRTIGERLEFSNVVENNKNRLLNKKAKPANVPSKRRRFFSRKFLRHK